MVRPVDVQESLEPVAVAREARPLQHTGAGEGLHVRVPRTVQDEVIHVLQPSGFACRFELPVDGGDGEDGANVEAEVKGDTRVVSKGAG